MNPIKFAIVTVSDSCFNGEKVDGSGPLLAKLIKDGYSAYSIEQALVSDNFMMIKTKLTEFHKKDFDIIFTVGGTGLAPSDVTPEATKSVITREAPGIIHAILNDGLKCTSMSMLSRAVCGIVDKTLIINLSGSEKAVREQFFAIKCVLPHAVALIRDYKEKVQVLHENLKKEDTNKSEKENISHEVQFIPSKVKISAPAGRDRTSPYKMISVNDAHDIIKNVCVQTSNSEVLHMKDVLGRVLAEDVMSSDDLPPFPSSIKDGYAVIASDQDGRRTVLDGVAAGDAPTSKVLQPGQCIRISTGAPVPPGADAVVQVEDTTLLEASADNSKELEIQIKVAPEICKDIRPKGSDIESYSVVLKKGIVLNAPEIGVLAAVGHTSVKVYKRPVIGLISTGNEVQDPNEPLQPGQIRDSNKMTLLCLLKQYGYDSEDLGLAKDDPNAVKRILQEAFEKCDMVITTGGVSMGEFDIIKRVITEDFGGRIHFGRVNMKPGKPTTLATCLYKGSIKTIFGLPGNPVSATVTCLLFVIPTLRFCENRKDILYPLVDVKMDVPPNQDPERPEYHRVHLSYGSVIKATSTGNQISSRLNSFVGADGLILNPSVKCLNDKKKPELFDYSDQNIQTGLGFTFKNPSPIPIQKTLYACYLLRNY